MLTTVKSLFLNYMYLIYNLKNAGLHKDLV